MRATISVYVRGRGEGADTTGREVLVTANGHLLPCRSIKLEVNDRKATVILEVDVDEVHVADVLGKITDSEQAKTVPDGS